MRDPAFTDILIESFTFTVSLARSPDSTVYPLELAASSSSYASHLLDAGASGSFN